MKSFALPRPRTVAPSGPFSAWRTLTQSERLTACWFSLTTVLVATRFYILRLAENLPGNDRLLAWWWPVVAYQDVAMVTILAWSIASLSRLSTCYAWQRAVRVVGWIVGLLAAVYSALAVQVFAILHTPLTYRLLSLSDHLRGVRASIEAAVTKWRAFTILAPVLLMCLFAALLIFGTPSFVRRVQRSASSPGSRLALGIYLAVSIALTHLAGIDDAVVANAHLSLLASPLQHDDPFINDQFADSDIEAFRRPPEDAPRQGSEYHGGAANSNVLIVVLESVGASYLGHYSARFDNTHELTRLANGGVTFDRIYASQPLTSNAMVGMFSSLHPWHTWRSLPKQAPGLPVAGLGDVLQGDGYRTAFIHSGNLRYDAERDFLRQHGFGEVLDAVDFETRFSKDASHGRLAAPWSLYRHQLPDRLLAPLAMEWIDADRKQPFFLVLWTIQTHHPYVADPSLAEVLSEDPDENRFVNAIRSGDQLIGELSRELSARGLTGSTLFVVTGDHGEAFGQHGFRGHGATLHEEAVWVPLVMTHPALSSSAGRNKTLGEQIDIAPTVLDLLGLECPRAWQGRGLFANDRPGCAYLFTGFHHFLFGLVTENYKYVYNATMQREELYDLAADPSEQNDLGGVATSGLLGFEPRRRLAGWLHCQNRYLTELMASDGSRHTR